MKIVVNKEYGGFGISEEAEMMLVPWFDVYDKKNRTHPVLVEVVEALGIRANGRYAQLSVVEIPDTATDWDISDYDGFESIVYVVDGKLHWA